MVVVGGLLEKKKKMKRRRKRRRGKKKKRKEKRKKERKEEEGRKEPSYAVLEDWFCVWVLLQHSPAIYNSTLALLLVFTESKYHPEVKA